VLPFTCSGSVHHIVSLSTSNGVEPYCKQIIILLRALVQDERVEDCWSEPRNFGTILLVCMDFDNFWRFFYQIWYFFDFLIWCEKNQITSPLRNLKIWYFFNQFLSNRYVTYSSNSYVHACYSALQMTDIGR